MKNLLIFIFLLAGLSIKAQTNLVGKPEMSVYFELLGYDNGQNSMKSTNWKSGDTLVVSVYYVERTIDYHPIYYFLNGICVKQRIICSKKDARSSCVEEIFDYIAPENTDNNKIVLLYKTNR